MMLFQQEQYSTQRRRFYSQQRLTSEHERELVNPFYVIFKHRTYLLKNGTPHFSSCRPLHAFVLFSKFLASFCKKIILLSSLRPSSCAFVVYLFFFFLLTEKVYSQGYPIVVTTQVIPPYTVYLSDYATETRLNIVIQPLDLSLNNYRAKLMVEIKSDRINLNSNSLVTKEVLINSGEPQILNGYDVATLLIPEHLSISGADKGDFYRTGRLPEGFYTFNFYLVDYYRNITVAQTVPALAFLVLNDPPIINEPKQGQRIQMTDPQNILFQWTPRHTGSPNSAFTCQYQFDLYEVLDKSLSAGEVVSTSMPFYTTIIENSGNSYLYGVDQSTLIPGRDYVFRIKVFDTEGRDLFRNNGYSEAIKFTYGQECLPPKSIFTKPIAGNGISATWDQSAVQTSYNVQYKKEGNSGWYTAEAEGAGSRIYDLTTGTKYYMQIRSYCGTFESAWSDSFSFIAPLPKEKKEFQCSANSQLNLIANVNPLPRLKVGDIIQAGGYYAMVTKVISAYSPFSGECLVTVPYFSFASVPHVFTNIKLNTDYEMYEGELVSKSNPKTPFLSSLDNYEYKFDSTALTDNQFMDGKINILEIPPTIIDGTIEKVEKGPQENTITIAKTNGSIQVLSTGNPMLLADDSGNQYAVDSNGNIKQVPKDQQIGNYAATKGNTAQENTSVIFKASENQQFGFDNYRFEVLQKDYNLKEIENKDVYVSWKSLETGKTDNVAVEINVPAGKEIQIADENGIPYVISEDLRTHKKTINISAAGYKSDQTTLTAYYTEKDANGKEIKITAGELDLVTYEQKQVKIKIIPVNNAVIPAENIEEYLNRVYMQAAVNFTVTAGENLTVNDWDLNGNNTFDEGQNQVFSNYTEEMNHIIEKYKSSHSTYDEESNYLFVLPFKPATAGKLGQMPITKQWGFIFLENAKSEFSHTVAHELGHGAFRLEHPYSQWGISERSTKNLMDYTSTGTELYKYQWDWVQDPGWKVYGLLGGEESASLALFDLFFDDDDDVLKKLAFIKKCVNEKMAVAIKANDDQKERELIAKSIIIEKTGYNQIKINYTPAKEKISFNPVKYTMFSLESSQIPYYGNKGGGFSYSLNGKNVFKITVYAPEQVYKKQLDSLKSYLFGNNKIQNEDYTVSVTWVSQFDESIFGKCTGCWKWCCCKRACEYMIGKTECANCSDTLIAKSSPVNCKESIIIAKFSDDKNWDTEYNSKNLIGTGDFNRGINYIRDEIKKNNRPIVIGVHFTNLTIKPAGNANKATYHFMIIRGTGKDDKGEYLKFFDPGRTDTYKNNAISEDNKLYIEDNFIKGDYQDETYTITEIKVYN